MNSIHTLIPDIYSIVGRKDGWFTDQLRDEFAHEVAEKLSTQLGQSRGLPTLRLSKMGPSCPCALWYSIHHPELAEALPPWAEIKYSYGHILEALVISLAKASGHDVRGEQDEIILDGVHGHRDCVIDGCIVDVKSSSSFSFKKFKDGSIRHSDTFGYLDQLDGYLVGSYDDPIVTVKDRAYLLAIDKQLGHMVLYEHHVREQSILDRIKNYKQIVSGEHAPTCTCGTVADGSSGNRRLDTRASYSPQKFCCFPSLRTFLYSDGPRYLTQVVRKPDVQEIDRR